MRLPVQAELATDYFQLRMADDTHTLLEASIKGSQRPLQITQAQYDAVWSLEAMSSWPIPS